MANGGQQHEVLYPKEAATRLRISYRSMLNILRSGRGPSHAHFGKQIRIDARDFEEWRRVGTGKRQFRRKRA